MSYRDFDDGNFVFQGRVPRRRRIVLSDSEDETEHGVAGSDTSLGFQGGRGISNGDGGGAGGHDGREDDGGSVSGSSGDVPPGGGGRRILRPTSGGGGSGSSVPRAPSGPARQEPGAAPAPDGGSEPIADNAKFRHFVFTWNNYPVDAKQQLSKLGSTYFCYQPERGVEGTRHLQGVISFKNPRAFRSVAKLIRGWHIEKMRGTIQQAVDYCSKEETRDADAGFGFTEEGDRPLSAGTAGGRSDLQAGKYFLSC